VWVFPGGTLGESILISFALKWNAEVLGRQDAQRVRVFRLEVGNY
jgi:hypothetical protein